MWSAAGAGISLELALVLAITFTLPFEFTKQWFPAQWIEVSRILIGLAIAVLAWRAIQRRLDPIDGRLLIGASAVVAVGVVSFAFTQWPTGAKDAAAMVLYALFGAYVSQVTRTPRATAAVVAVLAVSGVLVGAIATSQEGFGYYIWRSEHLDVLSRRNATFNDPNITARFLLFCVAAVICLAARASWRGRVAIMTLTGVMGIFALGLLVTQSRFGWLLAAGLVAGWVPIAATRRPVALALAVFTAIMVVGIVTVPFARARIGLDQWVSGGDGPPRLIAPVDGATLLGSSHVLRWEPRGAPVRTRLEIRNATSGELVEPPRDIRGDASSDLIGSTLDAFDSTDGRTVRGARRMVVRVVDGPEDTPALGVEISGLEAGRAGLVTGPPVRHSYDGASGAIPFRIWVRASSLTDLGSVRIVFRFQGLESSYAAFDVTPVAEGTWDEALIPKDHPTDQRGSIDWSRVRRIDVEVRAGGSGRYDGEVRVADLRIGTVLAPQQTYEWRVATDHGAGYGMPLVAAFAIAEPQTVERLRVAGAETAGTVNTTTPVIAWEFSGDQTAYRVLVSGDSDFDSGLLEGASTRFQIPAGVLSPGGHYVVEVIALDEYGFTAVPAMPLLITVADEGAGRAMQVVWRTGSGGGSWPQPVDSVNSTAGSVHSFQVVGLDRIRASLIAAGLAMFSDHPVVGVGLGGFQPMLLGPYREYMLPEYRERPTILPHTHVVEVAAETGVVGLTAYGALIATAGAALLRRYRTAAPSHRPLILWLASALVLILLSSQVEGRFFDEPYMWLFLGMLAGMTARGHGTASRPARPRIVRLPRAALLALAGAFRAIVPPRCPACSAVVSASDVFCASCGQRQR